MVFRISKIHTNADFTFSNNNDEKFKKYYLMKGEKDSIMSIES